MSIQQTPSIDHCGFLLNYYFDDLDIESLFEKWMPLQGRNLNYHDHYFTPAIAGTTLEEHLDHTKYKKPKERFVVILQIPPKYLGKTYSKTEIYSGDEEIKHYPLVPLLDRNFTSEGETHHVTPHVIVGYLNAQTGEFIQNPNYNLYFDPSGLRYTEEQIAFLKEHNSALYQEAIQWRATAPREILEKSDKENGVFKEVVAYYQNEETNRVDRNRHRGA